MTLSVLRFNERKVWFLLSSALAMKLAPKPAMELFAISHLMKKRTHIECCQTVIHFQRVCDSFRPLGRDIVIFYVWTAISEPTN